MRCSVRADRNCHLPRHPNWNKQKKKEAESTSAQMDCLLISENATGIRYDSAASHIVEEGDKQHD
jgi:hypothetical protein